MSTKQTFNVKGIFLNDKYQMVDAFTRARNVDIFLLIGPLSAAIDVSDEDNETKLLMDTFGDIAIENIDCTNYKIGDKVIYKPMQEYKRGKQLEMKQQEMQLIEVLPHAFVGDLSIEYKICNINDNSDVYYGCHESLLRPIGFKTGETDKFDTT